MSALGLRSNHNWSAVFSKYCGVRKASSRFRSIPTPAKEMSMKKSNRRNFLKHAAAASAVFPLFTIAGTKASGRVLGANDVIRVGVTGIHGQGNAHIDQYLGLEGVQVTHLIDPD